MQTMLFVSVLSGAMWSCMTYAPNYGQNSFAVELTKQDGND